MIVPGHPVTIPGLLGSPDGDRHTALESLDATPATHAQLIAFAGALAGQLRELDIQPGKRVAIVSANGPSMVTAFLAATAAGIAAPLNPAYGRAELDFFLEDLEPALLVVDATLDTPARDVARARGVHIVELAAAPGAPSGAVTVNGMRPDAAPLADPSPDDVALILHTSGTTSRPKMVPLTHRNLSVSAHNVAASLALGPEDRSLVIMPLFHIHGLVAALLASLASGGTVIVPPGFVVTEFAGWLARFSPTWYSAVPTMHQAILQRLGNDAAMAQRNAAPLRFVRSSSAALAPRTIHELESVLRVPVIEAYGMTEAAHQMCSNPHPPAPRKPGSVGPAAGPDVAIMGSNGSMMAAGETGEIVIRGPNVTGGYIANPAANAEAFINGWFRTGDQGVLDGDGYLTITGRIKELINRAGEKIAPLEVDAILAEHPAVAQAICFGIPHPVLGEDIAAAVVLRPGRDVTPRALREHVARHLAYFKVPRHVVIVPSIPVGATGKLQRRGLGELLGVQAEVAVRSGDTTPPSTPIEEIVTAAWTELLGTSVPGIHENFFAIGGDSILATRIVSRLRSQLQVELPLLSFFDTPTVAGIARELEVLLDAEGERG